MSSETLVRTILLNGHTIEIHADQNAESPREWDNLGIMLCGHCRHNLGDVQVHSPEGARAELAKHDIVLRLPLYLYDHSGLTMQTTPFHGTNAEWDPGQVGEIIATREAVCEEFNIKRIGQKHLADVKRILEQEVKTYDQFLRHDMYGYVIRFADGTEDSCWGMYGLDYCEREARSLCRTDLEKANDRLIELARQAEAKANLRRKKHEHAPVCAAVP